MKAYLLALGILGFIAAPNVVGQERDVDSSTVALHRIVATSPEDLRALFRYSGESMPMVSAHRGGAGVGFPENSIETFAQTLRHSFAMLEIDPRMTKDGQVVIHHDATLERTTTGSGKVADHTLAELKQLWLKDSEGNVTQDRIPTLDEVIEWARGKTVLVLDQKDVPLELRVSKVREHDAESFVMLIVNHFKEAEECHAADGELMMEVMVADHHKVAQFDASGVPWSHVIAFVGHVPPTDVTLYQAIHERGACCMIGTSRNLDITFAKSLTADGVKLHHDYVELLKRGADVIETDLPREIEALLFQSQTLPQSKQRFFLRP